MKSILSVSVAVWRRTEMKNWSLMDRFFGYQLVRGLVALILLWSGWAFPTAYHHADIRLAAGVMLGYNVVLFVGRRLSAFSKTLEFWPVFALVCDFAVAELVLVEYSHSPGALVWVFLPLLAYEAWAYWGGPGLMMGTSMTVLMVLANGWLVRSLWHQSVPVADLIFWAVFLIVMSVVPLGIMELPPVNSKDVRVAPLASFLDKLTPREREVYECLGKGLSASDTARALHIELSTVKTHIKSICNKFGVAKAPDLPRL